MLKKTGWAAQRSRWEGTGINFKRNGRGGILAWGTIAFDCNLNEEGTQRSGRRHRSLRIHPSFARKEGRAIKITRRIEAEEAENGRMTKKG